MKILVANWKQNMNLAEVEKWLSDFAPLAESLPAGTEENIKVILCPSHPYLPAVAAFVQKYPWLVAGSQDISQYPSGTHTGEVGALQAADFAKYCIVGHSERGESDEVVQLKINEAHAADLIPIVCFVQPERLSALNLDEEAGEVVLLWEDPGNISHGGVFTPKPSQEIAEGTAKIKQDHHITSPFIYGGSINRQNAYELANIPGLDGGIAGGASLDPKHLFEIIQAFAKPTSK
ncbi:hypothetical protein A2886_01410 [candidate division WWE3 bacterium RIFCSPHIGHO2_01_FULL_42_13]|uniref:Triosephosphate isomerase n=1 Tax=candidate division WWE3 bacterium RIFCSPHIGHO2_01_FULL_42_13 TaxID=1802617 RepID=A0A1F4USH6_UNCKA|nr:MAG: hypothetical protein A2886_01410 [candidate division WWE3 bacterium RIFCSPHIGHO2_01_FULL_42_13]